MSHLALLLATTVLHAASAVPGTSRADTLIDSSRSRVRFELPLLVLGKVQGSFEQVRGSVRDGPAGVQVCAEVTVASAHMPQQKDTDELLSAAFFDAARFPRLLFKSLPIPRAQLQAGKDLAGNLTVRGITRPTAFQIVQRQCPGTNSSLGCQLVLQGSLKRGEFGMRARRGVLGDSVALRLQIQLCDAPGQCAATAPGCD